MNDQSPPSLLDRTIENLRFAWREIAGSARGRITVAKPDLSRDDLAHLREQMRACLDGRGGEVSARSRAANLGRTYLALNRVGRERFLRLLAEDFDLDRNSVDAAIAALTGVETPDARIKAEQALRMALEPPRLRLLTQFNGLPEGVKFLVDLRAELLGLIRENPALRPLEADLKGLLASWFDVGFLELRRITWNAPASLLEKLIAYEAVHEIRSWDDLKNRLDQDRRCFAFFHPRMPAEPLIFVEVALVNGMANNIHSLLDEDAPLQDPREADTAIFFSISNAQKGLAGISFGNFLIKRVVDDLAAELKGLRVFATLSPIPGFRWWLDSQFVEPGAGLLLPAEEKSLAALPYGNGGVHTLRTVLSFPWWHQDEAITRTLRGPLMRLCARYLVREKRSDGRVRDPVAHFHLSNGARMERLNWLGDVSRKGLEQSCGMMMNYLYRLDVIEANHESYSSDRKIAMSPAVRALVRH